jgi:hypothetical protein
MPDLDTREKRASAIAIALYPAGPSVQPDGAGLDDEDRQIAGYGYSGIAAGAGAGGSILPQMQQQGLYAA